MLLYNKKIFKRCFLYRGKYWYKNIKEIPRYFKLIHHLIKYGYDMYARYDTCDWFIDIMKDILTDFRENHIGYPVDSLNDEAKQEKSNIEYDTDFDKMISLLSDMDECNPKYENYNYKLILEEMDVAKDKFFELFSKHFYSIWN